MTKKQKFYLNTSTFTLNGMFNKEKIKKNPKDLYQFRDRTKPPLVGMIDKKKLFKQNYF
jgi:hypothetical protein